MDDRSPSEERPDPTSRDTAGEKTSPPHLESAEGPAIRREEQLQAELEHLLFRAIDQRMGEVGVDLDAEDALAGLDLDEQSFYREFVAKSNDAMYVVDLFGTFKFVNQTAERLIGYSQEELIGENIAHFLYPEGLRKAASIMASLIRGRNNPPHELVVKAAGGDRVGEMSVTLIKRGAFPVGILGIARDVTERKKAEAVLRESETRYRKLVELSPDAVAIVQDDVFAYANPAFTEIFGYPREDLEGGLNYLSITQEKDRETIRKRARAFLAGKEVPTNYQIELISKDGRILNCEVSASLIEHHGRPASLVIFRDHTDKVQARRLLQVEHELAAGLAVATSLEGGLELCLASAFRVSGMEAGGIYLADKERKAFHLCCARNLSPEFVDSVKSLPFGSFHGKLKLEGGPVFSLTCDRPEPGRRLLEKEGLRFLAVIPLFHEEEVVGSMNIASRKVSEVQPWERQALIGITSQTGNAVARLESESALRESEERYRQLVANIPVVAWKSDSDGQTIFISPNVERMYGYTPEEIMKAGSTLWFGRIHDDDRGRVKRSYQGMFTEGGGFDVEYRIRRRDGVWIWIRDRACSRQGTEGKHNAFGVFNEITERKEAEEALRRSEDEHRALVAALAQGVQEIDTGGTIIFANRAHHRIYGYDEGELVGMSVLELSPDEKTRRELAEHLKYLLAEQPEPTPWIGEDITKDGKRIQVQADWDYKRDNAGRVVGFTSVISDITERQRAEEALRESEERYRSLVEKTEEIIFSLTDEGRFNFLNPAFSRVMGWKAGEWLGRSFEELAHPDDRPSLRARLARVLKGETLPQNEARIRTSRGDTLTVEYTTVPIRQKERIVEIWGIARDITSRVRAEEDHRRLVALREREDISRWLHDHLGADLYNIILLVDSLQKQDPDVSVAAQQLDWISETSRKALASIRNYLDFSSQMGASFSSLVEHMEKYGRSLLTPLGMGFDVTCSGAMETCALSGLQSFSIYLIFKEALTNIVKHARAGHVDITVTVGEESLEIVIADDGEGFTSDTVISGQYGTANIRARAEEMGADLYITTEPRQGTKVKFALPIK